MHNQTELVHSGLRNARDFFTKGNADTYDQVVRYATIGRDKHWKNNILTNIKGSTTLLDLASGTGILSEMIRNSSDVVNIFSLDLSFDYARASKNRREIQNVINANAEMLPFRDSSCDCIVSSYLAKYVDIDKLMVEISRVITPNGVVVFHDFSYPRNKVVRLIWKLHFKLLCMVGLVVTPWKQVFSELDKIIESSTWSNELLASLKNHGFIEISSTYFTFGTSQIIVAKKNE